jgi:intracellular sulfur oxidation DsrE/DsrF family protein
MTGNKCRLKVTFAFASAFIPALILSFNVCSAPLGKPPIASTNLFHPERIIKISEAPEDQPFAEHFAVFHISSGDDFTQTLVLNNAQNLANHYGPDKVVIEIVAYGPGLKTLFKENANAKRIARMSGSGITFTACGNTMQAMGRSKESLNKHSKVVPGGVIRIMELQEAGWTYIRP